MVKIGKIILRQEVANLPHSQCYQDCLQKKYLEKRIQKNVVLRREQLIHPLSNPM